MTGADEVVASWAQRIYTDKAHKNLVYFDHTVITRTGRSFSNVSYGFQASNNSKDKDFGPITQLVEMQVAKTGAVFTE